MGKICSSCILLPTELHVFNSLRFYYSNHEFTHAHWLIICTFGAFVHMNCLHTSVTFMANMRGMQNNMPPDNTYKYM